MALYQPNQNLTWRYSTGSGQLSVVSTIAITLGPGEFVTSSASAVNNGTASITLTVTTISSLLPPLVMPYVVRRGFTTKDQVRAFIQTLNPVTVVATCYKNSILAGENETMTQTDSEIVM